MNCNENLYYHINDQCSPSYRNQSIDLQCKSIDRKQWCRYWVKMNLYQRTN